MSIKLMNAFSLNMVADGQFPVQPQFKEISIDQAKELLGEGFESCVGHADTANLYTGLLGISVPAVRATISLKIGDIAVIGQYRGTRLPEGAHKIPEGATIQWIYLVV